MVFCLTYAGSLPSYFLFLVDMPLLSEVFCRTARYSPINAGQWSNRRGTLVSRSLTNAGSMHCIAGSQQPWLTSSSLTQAAGAATLSHSSPISSSQKLIPEASPSCCLNAQEQKFAIIFCLEKHLKLGYTCLALSQLCFLSLSTCSVAHCSCQDLAQLIKSLVSAQAQ